MSSAIQSIVHPTDFSDLSHHAFAHALRVAVAAKSRLHLLHVTEGEETKAEGVFPRVHPVLKQWGLAEENETAPAIITRLGLRVSDVKIDGPTPVRGILQFLDQHACDLVVLATHGRGGVERLLKGSVAEDVSRRAAIPTLFVPTGARGFVDRVNGDIALRRILVPIDHAPAPARAVEAVRRFAQELAGNDVTMFLLHVGTSEPVLFNTSPDLEYPQPIILRSGPVVTAILQAAAELDVDLIGMPTAGHHGMLDALRGSTTERVLRHAPCPILAIPAA